jgi:hypothetical protein
VQTDIQIYTNSMARIRERIDFIADMNTNKIEVGSTAFKAELMFVQFRKILEEIAFSTLAANRDEYEKLHANFAVHWKAKAILKELRALNPDFYPVPHKPPVKTGGKTFFGSVQDGFMTPDEFVTLYQASSEVIHTRNPYKGGDPTIRAKYTVAEWIKRIQKLLTWHRAQLINGSVWVVNIPPTGHVNVWAGAPNP